MTKNRRSGAADATVWLGCLLNPQTDAPLPDEAEIGPLIDAANAHYLVPALYRALQERKGLSRLPDTALGYMQAMDAFALSRQRTIQQQLSSVLDALRSAPSQPVLLKGAAMLAEGVYLAAHTRLMFDLDLLLPPQAIEAAVVTLQGHDYRFAPGREENGLAEHFHHAPPLLPPGEGVAVELHRAALARRTDALLSNQCLMAAVAPAAYAHARVPSATHQLWLAFVHTQLSHQHHLIHRFDLRHGLDIVHLTRHYGERIDWEWLDFRAKKHACWEQLLAYYALLEHFTQFRVPGSCTEAGAVRHVRRVCRSMERGVGLINLLNLRASDLKQALSREDIEQRYGGNGTLRLQTNRLRFIFHLLKKFSRPASWLKRRELEWRRLGL